MPAFNVTEQPTIPDVYEVIVNLHGTIHPKPHEPTLYAYHDGIDSWGPWEFSRHSALRASGPPSSMRRNRQYPWREIPMKLEEFIANKTAVRNAWVRYKNISIYVRRSAHMIDQELRLTFDLANMNADEETHGSGNFWKIIKLLNETLESPRLLYVENVQNPRLADSLRKRGWNEIKTEPTWPSSFYLELSPL